MKLFFIVFSMLSAQAMASTARDLAGRYEGLGVRAQRCEVVISEQNSRMEVRLIQSSVNTLATFSGETQSISDNAEVISNGTARAVMGFGVNGDLQIVMISGAGQNQECGSLKQL